MYLGASRVFQPQLSRSLAQANGAGAVVCCLGVLRAAMGDDGMSSTPALQIRTGTVMLINRLHACQTGKR